MRSESQKRADKNYRTKQLSNGKNKQINATLAIDDYKFLDSFCKSIGLSKAQTIIRSVKYCYEHNIDLHEQINSTNNTDDNSEQN